MLSGLVAISARTHNALSPTAPTPQTIQSLVQELKASDIPPSKIVEFVGAKYFGVLPNGSAAPLPPDGKDSLSATKFFAAKANDCNSIPSVADRTLTEKLGYLDSLPGTPFADLSKRIRSFPEDRREAAYDAGILLLCGA